MRRLFLFTLVLLGLLAGTAGPATAITGDYVEDREHPFVGLVVFYDATGTYMSRCSGSLLTPTVFLTAGHCTNGATTARVYFQQDAGANFDHTTGVDPVTGYPETCAAKTLGVTCATSDELYNYGFDSQDFLLNTRDAGLVILDQPITLAEYGSLAAAGSLDQLATERGRQKLTLTASGYGLTKLSPVEVTSYRERLMAQPSLTNLRSALTDGYKLQTNGNGSGRGGNCYGDSGGPVFYGGFTSNTIVGVASFGLNRFCKGVNFAYRTDQAAVLTWIQDVVGESEFAAISVVQI